MSSLGRVEESSPDGVEPVRRKSQSQALLSFLKNQGTVGVASSSGSKLGVTDKGRRLSGSTSLVPPLLSSSTSAPGVGGITAAAGPAAAGSTRLFLPPPPSTAAKPAYGSALSAGNIPGGDGANESRLLSMLAKAKKSVAHTVPGFESGDASVRGEPVAGAEVTQATEPSKDALPVANAVELVKYGNGDNSGKEAAEDVALGETANVNDTSKGTAANSGIVSASPSISQRTIVRCPGSLVVERPTSKRVDGRQYRGAKDLGVAKGHGSLIRFRPQEDLVVHWELSPENLKVKENSSSASSNTTEKNENNDSSSNGTEIPSYLLAIGLFRFGQSQNATPMFMKKLSLIKFTIRNGRKVFAGSHNFFAPKEAGQFVFRVYSTRSELSHFTVATSNPLLVYLKGEDLSNSLERLSTIFAAEENNNALLPLTSHISHFHSLVQCASPDDQSQNRKQSTIEFERKASEHLKSCFHSLLEFAQKAMVKYSELLGVERNFYESLKSETRGSDMTVIEESARDGKESTGTNTITTAGEGSAIAVEKSSIADSVLNKKHYSNKKLFSRIQCDTYDALMDMTRNSYIMTLLPAPQQRALEMILNFFCPIQRRFFESTEAMEKSLVGYLGFAPGSPRVVTNVPYAEQLKVFSALNNSISESLPGWFPAYDFSLKREAIRLRLLHMLLENKVLPTGSELVIFGSSRNNFGMDSSDLDMCILYPNNDLNPSRTSGGVSVQTEYSQKSAAIQQIGDFLREQSEMFENVQVRATARIPIVIFEDKLSGYSDDNSSCCNTVDI